MTFKARAARFPDKDETFHMAGNLTVQALKKQYCANKQVGGVRLFLRGTELKDEQFLGHCDLQGLTVQVFVLQ